MKRVLHLGNIANNAFHNARLLQQFDIESTVVCYDYFDPMACPEWDGVHFDSHSRSNYPNWNFLAGCYKRPNWFIQGYASTVQAYFRHGNRTAIDRESGLVSVPAIFHRYYKQRARFNYHSRRLSGVPAHWQKFKDIFKRFFPDREPLTDKDLAQGYRWAHGWEDVLSKYDITMAYACDPIIPMLHGVPYIAFEHGTLRDIPFEDNSRGRLTALSYAMAEHIFVTNLDCLDNAYALARTKNKVTFINHPFDESIISVNDNRIAKLRTELLSGLGCTSLVFFPTRHDWVPGSGYADKANDVLIRALGELVNEHALDIGLVTCRWGNNQRASESLLSSLGLADRTLWIEPQPLQRYWEYCRASDLVCDQFKLGSFGGVFFKALLSGAPVCSYINVDDFGKVFTDLPPIINGSSTEELVPRIKNVLLDDAIKNQMGDEAKRWMSNFHCGRDTGAAQSQVIKAVLSNQNSNLVS